MNQVIRQLIGGLYCQNTQECVLETHLRVLDGETSSSKPTEQDTHKWDHWPTTRQGDDCYNDSTSSHSSMPDLVHDYSSVSTHSSMPDLLDMDSDDSNNRIKNSWELCGNE